MRIGIAGAAGYTAGELIRILIGHPGAELRYIQSESHQGLPVYKVHQDLLYSRLFSRISIFQMLTYSFSVWDMGCRENF